MDPPRSIVRGWGRITVIFRPLDHPLGLHLEPGGYGSCQTCAFDRPKAQADEQRGKRMLLLKGTVCMDRKFASHLALVHAVGTWRPRDEREVKEVSFVVVVDKVGRKIACVRWGTQLRSRQPGRRLMMTGVSPL